MGANLMYTNPFYDINGDVIVQMEHNGTLIDVPIRTNCFIPNGVTLKELEAAFAANEPQEIAPYSGPSTEDMLENSARARRTRLLLETDLWGLADYPATAEQTAYRQALRDITAQSGFPTDITWPTKPE